MISLFLFTFGFFSVYGHGDHDHSDRVCGTQEYNDALEKANPEISLRRQIFENKWELIEEQIKQGIYKQEHEQNTITIPVVFHILYTSGCSSASCGYVTSSQVSQQLRTMNEDFSATNSDYSSVTPREFWDVRSGNTGINFITQEIKYVQTSVSQFNTNDAIKFSSQGGSNVVSPDKYLNFWSGRLSGGVLGYAQFPWTNSPSTDGVVNAPGTLCSSCGNAPYNLGRTATHEIGHWLALYHIWGDRTIATSCTTTTHPGSDEVSDTPPQRYPTSGCPRTGGDRTCPTTNVYSQDMWSNYMDYSYDECLTMFTAGQNARAWSSINQYRRGMMFAPITTEYFINHIYFNILSTEPTSNDEKCPGGAHQLFYNNNINKDSNSKEYIYGCMEKTNNMNADHISDIYILYGNNKECKNGYTKDTQNINSGNDEDIYFCFKKEISDPDHNNALLDITIIEDGDVSKLDLVNWSILDNDNINPNGVKLNFATKYGQYIGDTQKFGNNGPQNVGGTSTTTTEITKDMKYIIGGIIGLIILIVTGFIVWRHICKHKGFKDAITPNNNNEALIYGATELTDAIEFK